MGKGCKKTASTECHIQCIANALGEVSVGPSSKGHGRHYEPEWLVGAGLVRKCLNKLLNVRPFSHFLRMKSESQSPQGLLSNVRFPPLDSLSCPRECIWLL